MIEFTNYELIAIGTALEIGVNDIARTGEEGVVVDATKTAFTKVTDHLNGLGDTKLLSILKEIDNDETYVPPRKEI